MAFLKSLAPIVMHEKKNNLLKLSLKYNPRTFEKISEKIYMSTK
jgi:hypothetical protein